ncbi:MAG: family 16 glycosylhydrolase, partial [Akkermansiaceae bacterium]|nr:family 16 glycosylhydrolase [Akkermansiaceae bacterium]
MIRLALFSVAPPRWCVVAVALSAATLQAAPPGLGWVMAWSDEFNGTSVDGSKWSVGTGARRDATNTTSAVSVGNGALTIKTYTEGGKHYTGWLGSNGKFENCFGYWEARIRFNSSAGMWSAFWLQPYGINNVGDPAGNGTEIDIVEHRRQDSGGGDMRNKSAMNIHWDGYGADHKSVGATVNNPGANPASLQGNWHTYGLLWESGRYRFYIDDVEVWTTTAAISQVRQWIYLTSEVQNGAWAGAIPSGGYGDRNSSTTSMEVDHVRFYQRAEQTINSHFGNRMGPWRQSGNTSWSSGGGRGGTAGARLNPSTTSGSRVEQTVAGLLPNTPYIVRGWGSVGSRSWPDIRIGTRNFGGAEVFTPVWSNGFTAADCAFTTGGSNSRADVFAWVPTQWGDCYADDITVSRAGRVTNGGFESGDASHWSFSGDAFTHQWASFIRSGGGAMRLNTSSAARSAEHTVRGLKPATAYRLSAWLRGNGQPVRLGVKNHGADESFTTVTGSGGNWTRGVHAFTTGADATAATIYAFIPSGSNIAAVDLDDFLLVEALPAGWSPANIGSGYPGEAGASDGRLLVRGSGNNLGTTADSCHFVYQPLEGSGKIAARLNSFEAHHDRAKAGVMIRGSTAPGAPFAMVHWLPEGQVEFIWRNAPDTASSYVWAAGTTAWPPRLRLIRALNVVTAQYSTDGANWVAVGAPQALDLPGTALAGLAVTSHSTTDSAEAVFSNVSFSGDRDNDGLPDEFETNTGVYVSGTDTGTDPDNPDTDGDGFADGFETVNGMDPLVPNLQMIWHPGAAPGGTGTWDTSSSHWTVGTAKSPWLAGKTALFGGTAGTVTVEPGVHGVGGLAFTTAGYTLAGSPLAFANEAEISLPAGTGAVTTFTMPLAGVSELRVSGGGRLDLRADNRPFAGAMVVDGNSQLRPYNTTTGAATGYETGGAETTVEIRSGSQIRWFNIAGSATYAANFHLAGEGISGGNAGALNFDTATARVITLDGAVTLDADATIGTQNNGAFLVNGPVDGPDHVLTLLTSGSTTTLNAAARLGGLVKSGVGALALGPAAVLAAPALTFNAGSLAIDPQASLAIGTLVCNATLALPVSQDLVLAAPLTGPGSLNKTGAGILTLAAANAFGPAGGTLTLGSGQADAGALRLAHPQAVGSHARILLNSG